MTNPTPHSTVPLSDAEQLRLLSRHTREPGGDFREYLPLPLLRPILKDFPKLAGEALDDVLDALARNREGLADLHSDDIKLLSESIWRIEEALSLLRLLEGLAVEAIERLELAYGLAKNRRFSLSRNNREA